MTLFFNKMEISTIIGDYEIISLPIKAGIHRLMVKMAPFPKSGSDSKINLNFHEQHDNGNDVAEEEYAGESYGYGGYSLPPMFALRLTDKTGKVYGDISSSFVGDFEAHNYEPKVDRTPLIHFYQNKISDFPDQLMNYYLLSKSYLKYGLNEEGEAAFAEIMKEHSYSLYF